MNVLAHQYLIIGGAPKAGTTSLFKWLAIHPDICASTLKESRFFLDDDYPLPSSTRFNGSNLEDYNAFFSCCDDSSIRMDATPDYLYSESALKIAQLLPRARMLVILRDPVDRMTSWYKFARQQGLMDLNTSFEAYVMAQVGKPVTTDTPIHMRALEQCRYEKYLAQFRRELGGRLLTVHFRELTETPNMIMHRVCKWLGIKSDIYANYKFTPENVSRESNNLKLKNAYRRIRRRVAYALHSSPKMLAALRFPNRLIKALFLPNQQIAEKIVVSEELATLIYRESGHINESNRGEHRSSD